MKSTTLLNLIENKTEIGQLETAELKTIIHQFPYFQTARALFLKGLKNQDSYKYNNELKITAAYTTDRTVLFNYITSNNYPLETKKTIHQQINIKLSEDILEKTASFSEDKKNSLYAGEKTEIQKIENKLEIGKPISFSSSENYSFQQWLQLSVKKPIQRTEEITVESITNKEEIINKFINTNPKIVPITKDKTLAVSVSKNKQDAALMTETLARVYLEQKKYPNAIQAYRILSLKYPEKSGYFADQIKRVQILQKNKL